tara:strand:+ start:745 stop:1164 length:420 start_codon:yes stop_codon:yes gene_type:complete
MAKYEEPFKDTQEIFDEVIRNSGLDRYINIKLLVDNKQKKKVAKPYKSPNLLKHETKNDVYIIINELIFEQLETWQKLMVAEEAIAGISFDTEKDKLEIKTGDISTFSGLLKKYGYERYEVVEESVKTLYNVERETAEV